MMSSFTNINHNLFSLFVFIWCIQIVALLAVNIHRRLVVLQITDSTYGCFGQPVPLDLDLLNNIRIAYNSYQED